MSEWMDWLVNRPGWQRDALCREYPDVEFFLSAGGDPSAAFDVCRRCVVRVECLAYAVEAGLEHGIWGGMSPRQRRRVAGGVLL